jgi:hypothetical protein
MEDEEERRRKFSRLTTLTRRKGRRRMRRRRKRRRRRTKRQWKRTHVSEVLCVCSWRQTTKKEIRKAQRSQQDASSAVAAVGFAVKSVKRGQRVNVAAGAGVEEKEGVVVHGCDGHAKEEVDAGCVDDGVVTAGIAPEVESAAAWCVEADGGDVVAAALVDDVGAAPVPAVVARVLVAVVLLAVRAAVDAAAAAVCDVGPSVVSLAPVAALQPFWR